MPKNMYKIGILIFLLFLISLNFISAATSDDVDVSVNITAGAIEVVEHEHYSWIWLLAGMNILEFEEQTNILTEMPKEPWWIWMFQNVERFFDWLF